MLGLYISGQKEFSEVVTLYSKDMVSDADENGEVITVEGNKGLKDGMTVTVGGIITSRKTKTTYGTMEIIVFPAVLERFSNLLEVENIVKIICEEVRPLRKEDGANPLKRKVVKLYLRVDDNIDNELMESIICMLKFFGGNTPVCLYNESQKKITVINELKRKMSKSRNLCLKFILIFGAN